MSPATLAYRAPREDVPGKADPETIKNLYMPLWLLGGGVVIQVIAIFLAHRHAGIEAALIAVGLQIIVGTTLMLVGILIAARFRGIALGPFWVAVFKLAAVSVAPGAAVALLTPALNFIPLGAILGWIGEFALYFALLGVFFDLDESDTWYCVCVIFLVHLGVYFLLLWKG